eukprot:gnl/Dysnectes_brevis/328_a363_1729.p1 GENE.gnl/Dysnectes_brevis/328_a363_1729~~gnl/Dysnectes_brevis/328_a363_1729.p1  ORF type:complete len:955 (-),score=235.64 gnl/Dysnectes_brevis/328_a363_1729:456-3320(-)
MTDKIFEEETLRIDELGGSKVQQIVHIPPSTHFPVNYIIIVTTDGYVNQFQFNDNFTGYQKRSVVRGRLESKKKITHISVEILEKKGYLFILSDSGTLTGHRFPVRTRGDVIQTRFQMLFTDVQGFCSTLHTQTVEETKTVVRKQHGKLFKVVKRRCQTHSSVRIACSHKAPKGSSTKYAMTIQDIQRDTEDEGAVFVSPPGHSDIETPDPLREIHLGEPNKHILCVSRRQYLRYKPGSGVRPFSDAGGLKVPVVSNDGRLIGKDSTVKYLGSRYGLVRDDTGSFSHSEAVICILKTDTYVAVSGQKRAAVFLPFSEHTPRTSRVQDIGAFSHACSLSNNSMMTSNGSSITILRPKSPAAVCSTLSSRGMFGEALTVAAVSDSLTSKVHALWGYYLFKSSSFQEAMEHFAASKCDPCCVLRLFSPLGLIDKIAGDQAAMREGHAIDIAPLGHDVLKSALNDLRRYLMVWRSEHEAEAPSKATLFSVVDMALLHAYLMGGSRTELVSFLQLHTHCPVDEAERLLNKPVTRDLLSHFYKHRGLHSKALKQLQSRGNVREMARYLLELGMGPKGHDTSQRVRFRGIHHKGATYVVKADPQCALDMYTSTVAPSVMAFDFTLALKLFETENVDLEYKLQLLEHAVKNADSAQLEFLEHQLAVSYFEQLNKFAEQEEDEGAKHAILGRAVPMSEVPGHLPPKSAVRANALGGPAGLCRRKLFNLLLSVQELRPARLLAVIPPDCLLEERALLQARRGNFEATLRILSVRLANPALAEAFCEDVWLKSQRAKPEDRVMDIYFQLLRVYLTPDEGAPFLHAAARLLARRYDRIESTAALKLLPSNTPLALLLPWMRMVFSADWGRMADAEVELSLVKGRAEYLQERLDHRRSVHTLISRTSRCAMCQTHIMRKACTIYSNGQVLCGTCVDKVSDDPKALEPVLKMPPTRNYAILHQQFDGE